ncbi:hypothetical protein MLD38_040201 [Melastoma candidum]|uniref:Uncharacterized protein n=1 Tax=Melastoma candidum TaxID=119954 RepID=A0ACB9L5P0_9MYRT|nr:hypothetical protein MLD38_040201 [Melastoma candidum]
MAATVAGRCALRRAMAVAVANSAAAAGTASPARMAGVFRSTGYHCRIASSRLIRRELSSLLPAHSALASACLVSKLPSELSYRAEGRFSNYVSPI